VSDVLIKNSFIATMDVDRRIYRRGSLYIDDGIIKGVGKEVEVPRSPEHVIDAE